MTTRPPKVNALGLAEIGNGCAHCPVGIPTDRVRLRLATHGGPTVRLCASCILAMFPGWTADDLVAHRAPYRKVKSKTAERSGQMLELWWFERAEAPAVETAAHPA